MGPARWWPWGCGREWTHCTVRRGGCCCRWTRDAFPPGGTRRHSVSHRDACDPTIRSGGLPPCLSEATFLLRFPTPTVTPFPCRGKVGPAGAWPRTGSPGIHGSPIRRPTAPSVPGAVRVTAPPAIPTPPSSAPSERSTTWAGHLPSTHTPSGPHPAQPLVVVSKRGQFIFILPEFLFFMLLPRIARHTSWGAPIGSHGVPPWGRGQGTIGRPHGPRAQGRAVHAPGRSPVLGGGVAGLWFRNPRIRTLHPHIDLYASGVITPDFPPTNANSQKNSHHCPNDHVKVVPLGGVPTERGGRRVATSAPFGFTHSWAGFLGTVGEGGGRRASGPHPLFRRRTLEPPPVRSLPPPLLSRTTVPKGGGKLPPRGGEHHGGTESSAKTPRAPSTRFPSCPVSAERVYGCGLSSSPSDAAGSAQI